MRERGCTASFSAAITTVSAILAPFIPPSVPLVVYAFLANVSVTRMFLACIVPAMLIAISLLIYNRIYASVVELPTQPRASSREIWVCILKGTPPLAAPGIIMAGILTGTTTAAEAGILACGYTILLGVFYGSFRFGQVWQAVSDTMLITAMIMIIIGFANGMGGGAAALMAGGMTLVTPSLARASAERRKAIPDYHYLPANAETMHWGFFSKSLAPQVEIDSRDIVTIETLTHHAGDDMERMVLGDPGAEGVFEWTAERKGVDRRGAGPMDASLFGRGAGEGLGVHIMTGPIYVRGAEPGDVIEVRILDARPRPSGNPAYAGRSFGSNAAAWWGFHYNDLITEPKEREVITIYEIDATGARSWARAVYNYRRTPQTDPFGVVHEIIDYPGVPVDHSTITKKGDPEGRPYPDPAAFRRDRRRAISSGNG
jgi:hypothetical protein